MMGTSFYRSNQSKEIKITSSNKFWGNCFYVSTDEEVGNGYSDSDHPYKMILENKISINYIQCYGYGDLCDETVQKTLVKDVENLINIKKPEDVPFIKWLGEEGYAFECPHDDSNKPETAIPLALYNSTNWEIKSCVFTISHK